MRIDNGAEPDGTGLQASAFMQLPSHLCDNAPNIWREPRINFPAARPWCADAAVNVCPLDQLRLRLER
ncbi:hypothetical protein I0E51_05485 [Pseudomonas lalucatii]|nr:hypothetical protein [Pseudomonas lalucatii]